MESANVEPNERSTMEFLIFLAIIAVIGGGVLWGRKYFRNEIERAKRINRANKTSSPIWS